MNKQSTPSVSSALSWCSHVFSFKWGSFLSCFWKVYSMKWKGDEFLCISVNKENSWIACVSKLKPLTEEKLKTLTTLLENPGSSPSTHIAAQSYLWHQSQGIWCPLWALGMHIEHRCVCRQNTLTHKTLKRKRKLALVNCDTGSQSKNDPRCFTLAL